MGDYGSKWVKYKKTEMAQINQQKAVYMGEYTRPMDDKRRLTVPSKWRFSGDETEQAYLALPNPNGSITLYPPEMTAKLYQKVSEIGMADQQKQKVILNLFRKGESLGCDKQGRIMLSEKLMAYANIAKEALLIGGLATFHIWNPQNFEKWDSEGIDDQMKANVLSELGI